MFGLVIKNHNAAWREGVADKYEEQDEKLKM